MGFLRISKLLCHVKLMWTFAIAKNDGFIETFILWRSNGLIPNLQIRTPNVSTKWGNYLSKLVKLSIYRWKLASPILTFWNAPHFWTNMVVVPGIFNTNKGSIPSKYTLVSWHGAISNRFEYWKTHYTKISRTITRYLLL